jgi:16S rRNA (guanine527-N7)-methyltransferase
MYYYSSITSMLSDQSIISCMSDYGVSANALQCEQIRAYIALILKWNKLVSLTSITDELEILKFHFGESAFALSAVSGINGRLADVGSGAGFPGLPIRIFGEAVDLLLLESNAKKCAFLSEAVRQLALDNVRIVRARFEDVAGELGGSLDFVVSRAVGGYSGLLKWAAQSLKPDGQVVLWVGKKDAAEIATRGGWRWGPQVSIPGSRRRFLLPGSHSKGRQC